jgi:hypothetical protein
MSHDDEETSSPEIEALTNAILNMTMIQFSGNQVTLPLNPVSDKVPTHSFGTLLTDLSSVTP